MAQQSRMCVCKFTSKSHSEALRAKSHVSSDILEYLHSGWLVADLILEITFIGW